MAPIKWSAKEIVATTIVALLWFDVLALGAYTIPLVKVVLLPIIVVLMAKLLLRNFHWAFILPAVELAWGSFGYCMACCWRYRAAAHSAMYRDRGGVAIPIGNN